MNNNWDETLRKSREKSRKYLNNFDRPTKKLEKNIDKRKNIKNYAFIEAYGYKGKMLFWFARFWSKSEFSLAPHTLLLVHRSIVFKIFFFYYFKFKYFN